MGNPAISASDFCRGGGGSIRPEAPLSESEAEHEVARTRRRIPGSRGSLLSTGGSKFRGCIGHPVRTRLPTVPIPERVLSGVLEMWLDGNLAYRTHRPTTDAMSRPRLLVHHGLAESGGVPLYQLRRAERRRHLESSDRPAERALCLPDGARCKVRSTHSTTVDDDAVPVFRRTTRSAS